VSKQIREHAVKAEEQFKSQMMVAEAKANYHNRKD